MSTKRKNKKNELLAATVKLVAGGGFEAATIRAIAREAGVTDAAVYRHYHNKEDLCWSAYVGLEEKLIRQKQHIVTGDAPLRQKLHEWVRLSYEYFDEDPAAFTFVFVVTHDPPESSRWITTRQGEFFMELIAQARATGEIRAITPEIALSHFVGVLLNVPRMINEGTLKGPASAYVDEVAATVWRIIRPESDGNEADSRV